MTIYFQGALAVKSDNQIPMMEQEDKFEKAVAGVFTKGCETYVLRKDDLGVITFDGCEEFSNYDFIEDLIKVLAKSGFIANGFIDYYGDYEGRYHIDDNEIRHLSESEMHVEDADDQTLIAELVRRGFSVSKGEENAKA